MQTPRLSVVIATGGGIDFLERALRALERQTGAGARDFEVVVVADGASDVTQHAVAELRTPLQVSVAVRPRSGLASARNAGWARAQAPIVLFLGQRVIAGPELVAGHLGAHAQSPRPRVVLGRVTLDHGRRLWPWEAYDDWALARKYAGLYVRETPSGIHHGDNFSIPLSLLREVGGYRAGLVVDSDMDLGHRLHGMGIEFTYEARAVACQQEPVGVEDWLQRQRVQGRMEVALFRDGGYAGGIDSLVACYHDRHPLNRLAVRLALADRAREDALTSASVWFAGLAAAAGAGRLSRLAMSCAANIAYWGGVRDGLRGRQAFTAAVRRTRAHRQRPYVPVHASRRG
ncbi:MAG TPA: glycosyltransferase family A protein [Candidatus Dormibacteraeota bacterium]